MENTLMYLDTYIIQQDMRIRLSKCILTNMKVEKGVSKFDIYLDSVNNELVLKIHDEGGKNE